MAHRKSRNVSVRVRSLMELTRATQLYIRSPNKSTNARSLFRIKPFTQCLSLGRTFEVVIFSRVLPAGVNLPPVNNVLAFEHVVVGMLGRGQTRMIRQDSNARPNFQAVESILIIRNYEAMLLRHLADR